jgi:acetyl esterase/lipase
MITEKYGSDPSQEGDLFIPNEKPLAALCLFHGGFWSMPYGREQLTPVALDLARKGFMVWNIGYRRIGAGGGWPGTFDDVVSSISHLETLSKKYEQFDLSKIVVIGHSAGGQLAIWAGKRYGKMNNNTPGIKVNQVIGLAPVVDLKKTFKDKLGNNSVFHLLGGSPEDHPERYDSADPMKLFPLEVPQLVIHGNADEDLPVQWSRDYFNFAHAGGENIEYVEIDNGGHMDYLDPDSKAISILQEWLLRKYKRDTFIK